MQRKNDWRGFAIEVGSFIAFATCGLIGVATFVLAFSM